MNSFPIPTQITVPFGGDDRIQFKRKVLLEVLIGTLIGFMIANLFMKNGIWNTYSSDYFNEIMYIRIGYFIWISFDVFGLLVTYYYSSEGLRIVCINVFQFGYLCIIKTIILGIVLIFFVGIFVIFLTDPHRVPDYLRDTGLGIILFLGIILSCLVFTTVAKYAFDLRTLIKINKANNPPSSI